MNKGQLGERVIVRNEEIIRRAGIADVTFDRVKEKELKEKKLFKQL